MPRIDRGRRFFFFPGEDGGEPLSEVGVDRGDCAALGDVGDGGGDIGGGDARRAEAGAGAEAGLRPHANSDRRDAPATGPLRSPRANRRKSV
mmetsp:Transcript_71599/g.221102  ORF Transcript_71599/g.221102 Transcript_71599/m.221102 type:complete len:92 (+) Transcript_71599:154-429(+)